MRDAVLTSCGSLVHMGELGGESRGKLLDGPIVVSLRDYGGFEKVGLLPEALPAEDAQITAQPGDVMLHQGDQITVFYGSNSWSYTPLAHIDATSNELVAAFGVGDIDVTFTQA